MLVLASKVTGLVSISVFTSLVCISVGITSSSVEIKICAITAGFKKYKSIIKKKKKKHDQIEKSNLLGKSNLDFIEVLISKALIDPYISYDQFVLVNDVLGEYN